MGEEHPIETGGVSRRAALKGIGAGAVIAWSAPAVLSVGSAAYGTPQPCFTCRPRSCCDGTDNPAGCDGGPGPCETGELCFCGQTTEGDCGCFQNVFGSGGPCDSSDSCPDGERCVGVCAGPFCLPVCGQGGGGGAIDGKLPLQA